MNQHLSTYRGRFTLLRHEVPKIGISGKSSAVIDRTVGLGLEDHFDLLLETDVDQLLTWRIPLLPTLFGDPQPEEVEVSALRIQNHRVKYLDYEGPIGNDRGTVTQVLSGTYFTTAADLSYPDAENCFDSPIGPLKLRDFDRLTELGTTNFSSFAVQDSRRSWVLKAKPTPVGTMTLLSSKSMSLLAGTQMAD